MQKSPPSENQVLMAHGFSILGKWIKSSLEDLVSTKEAMSIRFTHGAKTVSKNFTAR